MDSANVLIVEWFRLEGTFEHHLVLSPPTPPFSWLHAWYTLKLYEVAESLYSRAAKPQLRHSIHVWSRKYWAEGSSHLPHPAVCACAAQRAYAPLTCSQQSHYLCFKIHFLHGLHVFIPMNWETGTMLSFGICKHFALNAKTSHVGLHSKTLILDE